MTSETKNGFGPHWAICFSDGVVRYDEDDKRAEIYWSRKDARMRLSQLVAETEEVLHIEKMDITAVKP